jgi:hypothetical protein
MSTKRPIPRLDLNPSSADRWTTCTASPQFIMDNWDKIPPSSDTPYNMAGTTAHEVAASFLENRQPNPAECPVPVDEEMLIHGWNYHEYVLSFRKKGGKLTVETKKPLWYMPSRNAKLDSSILNSDSLHIFDYKYGEGVPVSPVQNKQLTIYAQTEGSSLLPFPADDFPVFVHIYQPRGRAGETGPGHVWETTWGEIAEIAAEIHTKAVTIQQGPDTPEPLVFAPSDKACQWCQAKGFCTARQASLADGFEVLDVLTPLPKPGSSIITMEQVQRILTHKDGMISWLNDAEAWAQDYMKAGGKIPGFKLVLSRGGNRYWSDPKKAAELLLKDTILKRDEVIEEKTVGPAGIEKLLGKGKLSAELTNLIAKPPGSPVLAPESDKREAIGEVTDDFEILPDQTEKT